jgi:hypothetical protein
MAFVCAQPVRYLLSICVASLKHSQISTQLNSGNRRSEVIDSDGGIEGIALKF